MWLLCRFKTGIAYYTYDILRHADLVPLNYPSSWHCMCSKLCIFWMHTSVWLIWAHFVYWNWMMLKIWTLHKRSLTCLLFLPLSWQRTIVWISCNWPFYSSWIEEEFEIQFNLIGVFLNFIPILPLTMDFRLKMMFEKLSRVFFWKFRSSTFWYMNCQILINWQQVHDSVPALVCHKSILPTFVVTWYFNFVRVFMRAVKNQEDIDGFGGFMILNSIIYVGFTIFFQCMGLFSLQLFIWLKYSHRIFQMNK